MTKFINISVHDEDLASGRVVGPREEFDMTATDQKNEHNKQKIEDGTFVDLSNKGKGEGK